VTLGIGSVSTAALSMLKMGVMPMPPATSSTARPGRRNSARSKDQQVIHTHRQRTTPPTHARQEQHPKRLSMLKIGVMPVPPRDLAFTRYCYCQNCMVYSTHTGGRKGSLILFNHRAIVLHQGGQCRWAGGMKGWLIRAQSPLSKRISCEGQPATRSTARPGQEHSAT